MKTANGLTAGDLEVWVEDANTDAEKMLAAFIGNSIRKGVEELTVLAVEIRKDVKEWGMIDTHLK